MGWTGPICAALAALSLLAVSPAAVMAQGIPGRALRADEAARWQAVGALEVSGHRGCTAVLISDHEAITAGHCVYNTATRKAADPATLAVVLGQRDGDAGARRRVTAVGLLPEYVNGPASAFDRIMVDIALLQLDAPVGPDAAVPLQVVDWPRPIGDFVDVVGYERGGVPGATIREGCTAISSTEGVTAVTCDLVSGLSGAPVLLRENPDAPPRLVATVSSRGTGAATGLAYVVSVAPHLEDLRAVIAK
jgi:V8-like Glu-specific endopeptidase